MKPRTGRPTILSRGGRRRLAPFAAGTALIGLLGTPMVARADTGEITVPAGQTVVVPRTVQVHEVSIATGGVLAAPEGYSLTMTVNGVETGQKLTATGGTVTQLQPGEYVGSIVLTVAQANPVSWQGLTFPFRQALYVDGSGVQPASSVTSALVGGRVGSTSASDIGITSTGEAFDGVYVNGGSYLLSRPQISLTGNGRADFVGYGAAVVANGTTTRLVIDGARISNQGAVRTGVVAEGGANVIVKNSQIATRNGVLPADYQSTVDLAYMQDVPWMLSDSGNVRATNLLGDGTRATYLNSAISSQGWGVLSTDVGQDGKLTAINSVIATGYDGYGSYAIGDATERFLGDQFTVGDYAGINRGGTISYADSTPAAVSALNSELGLGLTAAELAAVPDRATVINSRRFGVMWHGAGSVNISGHTQLSTGEATFLDKGQQVAITVDGSQGAQLRPANGILMQVMENDDPGPVMVNGKLVNQGVYTEPTGDPAKVDSFDTTSQQAGDAVATFTDSRLTGNFYNAIRGAAAVTTGPGAGVSGLNLVLNLDHTRLTGTVSATAAKHAVSTIDASNYQQLGEVTNTPQPVINNGVIVSLANGSSWTVTGTSYLSRLTVGAGSAITAPTGHTLAMTVDGVPTTPVPGSTYAGAITLTVQ